MIRRSCLAVQFFSLGLMIASYILFCFYVHLFIYLIIYLFIYSFIHLFVCLFTLFWLYMAWVSFSEKFFHIFSMQIFFLQQRQKTQVQADGLSKFFKDMLYQFFENTGRGWYLFFFWWWGWFPYVVVELRLMFMDWLLKDILQYLSLWTFGNLRWNNNAVN